MYVLQLEKCVTVKEMFHIHIHLSHLKNVLLLQTCVKVEKGLELEYMSELEKYFTVSKMCHT